MIPQPSPVRARQAGVDIMLAPYNDAIPFGQQDAVVAIFRTIENGYSMVKATGNGPSMITDYQGRVLASSVLSFLSKNLNVFVQRVQKITRRTPIETEAYDALVESECSFGQLGEHAEFYRAQQSLGRHEAKHCADDLLIAPFCVHRRLPPQFGNILIVSPRLMVNQSEAETVRKILRHRIIYYQIGCYRPLAGRRERLEQMRKKWASILVPRPQPTDTGGFEPPKPLRI